MSSLSSWDGQEFSTNLSVDPCNSDQVTGHWSPLHCCTRCLPLCGVQVREFTFLQVEVSGLSGRLGLLEMLLIYPYTFLQSQFTANKFIRWYHLYFQDHMAGWLLGTQSSSVLSFFSFCCDENALTKQLKGEKLYSHHSKVQSITAGRSRQQDLK